APANGDPPCGVGRLPGHHNCLSASGLYFAEKPGEVGESGERPENTGKSPGSASWSSSMIEKNQGTKPGEFPGNSSLPRASPYHPGFWERGYPAGRTQDPNAPQRQAGPGTHRQKRSEPVPGTVSGYRRYLCLAMRTTT